MKQATMHKPGTIEIRDIPTPSAGEGQLLMKIQRIGVCGSDIHVYHGTHPFTPYPLVQGHEVSATVEKVGPGVKGFSAGDRVTIMPQIVCGKCQPCRSGRYHICENLKVMGFQTTGAASEYFVAPVWNCLKFSPKMSFEEGAMIEPLAVAVHAVGRLGDVKGKKLVVYGAGPIGNLVAQTAKGLGAASVLITDTSDFRLKLASECGIDATVNPKTEDVPAKILTLFGPDRADGALECVGVQPTMEQAVANARKGTDIVVVGVFGELAKVDLAMVQDRELRLIGSLMYQREDYVKAIELIETKKVKLAPLFSNHFAFDNYLGAYEFIEKNRERSMKVFIDVAVPF